jgi:c(7)-type cytochrome triheme protein
VRRVVLQNCVTSAKSRTNPSFLGLLALGALVLVGACGASEKAEEMTGDAAGLVGGEAAEAVAEKAAEATAAAEGALEEAQDAAGAAAEAVGEKAAEATAGAEGALEEAQDAAGAAEEAVGEKVAEATAGAEAAKEEAAAPAGPGESVVRIEHEKMTALGAVEFSHLAHKDALGQDKLDCTPCHMEPPPLFQMKKRAEGESRFTMAEMGEGKACGKCHDGKTVLNEKTVFSVSSGTDCRRCHQP